MVTFSSDADILKYEPLLFGELHLPWQVLARGTGATLTGTTLTTCDVNLGGVGVSNGGVVYLNSAGGSLDGAYEIVSVDSATELTISVLRADDGDAPIPVATAEDVAFRISTFGPQAGEAAFRLTEHFGLRPGNPASTVGVDDIVDAEGLRRASVFLVISNVYALWTSQTGCETFWRKSLHYRQFFEEARQRCHVSVDLGSDGVADITRLGGVIRLMRD